MTDEPLVLGIESSCDETGVGIVRGHELLANEVASSVAAHVRFGDFHVQGGFDHAMQLLAGPGRPTAVFAGDT